MLKKLLFIPPILIGLAVLYYMASGRQAPERRPAEEIARTVRVIEAKHVNLVPRVIGFGAAYPGTVWTAISQVSGEVEYVHPQLKNGAILAAGTEIIRIAPEDFELAIAQAEANIRAAEARLAELEVNEQNTADLLEIEKRTLDLRQSELKRKKDLFAQGTVAQSALESEQREFLAQTKKVQDIQNTLRLLPTQRAVLREQIAVDRAKLASARLDLKRTRISLPFDARIGSVDVEQAQYVQTGSKLLTGDSVDVAEVEAQVPISQFRAMVRASVPPDMKTGITAQSLARVVKEIGFAASVRLRSGDDVIEWPARFARISDEVDAKTRTIGVIVAVDAPYAKAEPGVRPPLSKGMFVEIEVRTKPRAGAIAVPRAAVRNGRLYVVTDDNRLDIRTVKTGLIQGDITVVSDGLKAGERVVVSDLIPAVQGMLLDLQPDDDMQARINAEATGAAQP